MPKVIANSVRVGNIVQYENRLWKVCKTSHVKPGKGGAFNQMELKDIRVGTKLNERFRSADTVEVVRLDQKDFNYLYDAGDNVALMDPETYEQIEVNKEIFEEQLVYLQEGMKVVLEYFESEIISVTIPEHVVLEIKETESVVKGQTAAGGPKPAILENGIRLMVPTFMDAGEKIVVNTSTGEYVERAKG
jgi:elongation factor P